MKMTHVRNATAVLEVAGKTVLVDPMLGARGSIESFPSETGNTSRNPLVDLTVPMAELLNPDVVVVTHTHPDHWDGAAAALLPRDVPVLVQHAADAQIVTDQGFTDVRILAEPVTIDGTVFTRTEGQHGSDATLEAIPFLGEVMGFVVRHDGEPVTYFAGDTIMTNGVRTALDTHKPDVVVLNTGEARPTPMGPILMGPSDVVDVSALAPSARVVAVHMEALNHCPVTRAQILETAAEHGISDRVFAPADGEVLSF